MSNVKKILVIVLAIGLACSISTGLIVVYTQVLRRPFVTINYGSQLLAVSRTSEALLAYRRANGTMPLDPNELSAFGAPDYALRSVFLAAPGASTEPIANDTICVTARHPTVERDGRQYRYVGLASGDILLVPDSEARLGKRYAKPYRPIERTTPAPAETQGTE